MKTVDGNVVDKLTCRKKTEKGIGGGISIVWRRTALYTRAKSEKNNWQT